MKKSHFIDSPHFCPSTEHDEVCGSACAACLLLSPAELTRDIRSTEPWSYVQYPVYGNFNSLFFVCVCVGFGRGGEIRNSKQLPDNFHSRSLPSPSATTYIVRTTTAAFHSSCPWGNRRGKGESCKKCFSADKSSLCVNNKSRTMVTFPPPPPPSFLLH